MRFLHSLSHRYAFGCTLTLGLLGSSRLASAKPDEAACIAASSSGQTLRKQSKLLEARAQFEICASQTCPDVIKQDCIKWVSDVASSVPTVSLNAVDAADRDLIDVSVTVDGKPLVDKLDGKAVALDPGIHTFVFQTAGAGPVTERVVVNEGDRAKRVLARFDSLGKAAVVRPPPPVAPSASGIPIAPIIVGGFGLAALATGSILYISGKSSFPDKCRELPLFSTSSGSCPDAVTPTENAELSRLAESATARRDVGAGLMIGGGALALVGAVWLIIDVATSPRQAKITPMFGSNYLGVAGAF